MSRYFPHSAYAEDQPLAKTILLTHVATRAVTVGTITGGAIFGVRKLLRRPSPIISGQPLQPLPHFLRLIGRTVSGAIGLVSLATAARMWGREDIEWKDRTWRLLENKGQLETDDWTYGGMAAGLVATAALKRPVGLTAALGSAGYGSVLGTLGYLGWRYGVNGGRFE